MTDDRKRRRSGQFLTRRRSLSFHVVAMATNGEMMRIYDYNIFHHHWELCIQKGPDDNTDTVYLVSFSTKVLRIGRS